MSFNPPRDTLRYWKATGSILATDTDIALLERRLNMKAPKSYIEFMKKFGAVEFDDEIDCRFDCVYEQSGGILRRTQVISHIKAPETALRYCEGLQADPHVDLPSNLFPFGMDNGQGEILIEFGFPTERVFYWDFENHDWESGATRIGFVADDMYEFINNLKPFDE